MFVCWAYLIASFARCSFLLMKYSAGVGGIQQPSSICAKHAIMGGRPRRYCKFVISLFIVGCTVANIAPTAPTIPAKCMQHDKRPCIERRLICYTIFVF